MKAATKRPLKQSFHVIARSVSDARIAQFVTSDRCVEMETVLFSLPAIVALPAILALLFPSLRFLMMVTFYRHCENGFWRQSSKKCAILVIDGNYGTQGSLRVAGHRVLRFLHASTAILATIWIPGLMGAFPKHAGCINSSGSHVTIVNQTHPPSTCNARVVCYVRRSRTLARLFSDLF